MLELLFLKTVSLARDFCRGLFLIYPGYLPLSSL